MSTIFPITKQTTPICSAKALTGSYVEAGRVGLDTQNFVGYTIRYTKGDETSLQMKIETSVDGGTTWDQQTTEIATGGSIAVTLAERTYTGSGNYAGIVSPIKADVIRFSVKATAGTPTGTVTIIALPSWV
jgi:hypothetical protein